MKKMQFRWAILISLFGLVGLLAACAGGGEPNPDPTEVVKRLAGQYSIQLTAEDLAKSGLSGSDLETNLGTWLFELKDNGKFSATLNGKSIVDGDYGAEGNQLVIQLTDVCTECSCAGSIGRYTWTLEGDELRFTKDYDLCDGMVFVLTSKPLVRK